MRGGSGPPCDAPGVARPLGITRFGRCSGSDAAVVDHEYEIERILAITGAIDSLTTRD
jgi:hypothetical protein